MEARYIWAIIVGVVGYGSITAIILWAHQFEKRYRKNLIDMIRARGPIKR